jgi:MFS family permease
MSNVANANTVAGKTPAGWLTPLALAFLASCGLVYANFMSVTIRGFQDALHFSPQIAGMITSANLIGGAIGALLAAIAGLRASRKSIAMMSLVGIAALDVATPLFRDAYTLIALRSVHGIVAGSLIGFTARLIALTVTPERATGLSLVIQTIEYAASVYLIPPLLPKIGAGLPYLIMAGIEAAGLVTIVALPIDRMLDAPPKAHHAVNSTRYLSRVAILACGAYSLYEFSRFLVLGFALDMAGAFALTPKVIATSWALAGWVMAGAGLTAAVIGVRFGRASTILSTMIVRTALCIAVLGTTGRPVAFAVAVCAMSFFSMLPLTYFWGTCLAIDKSGRLAVISSFVSNIGLGLGPAAGGFILNAWGFLPLWIVSTVLGFACAILAWWPARLTDLDAAAAMSKDAPAPVETVS